MTVRTNNDIEGWHNGLHRRALGKWSMPFYLLLDLLHQQARLTALRIRLVSEKKLKRIQRAKYCSLQAKIFDHWDDYSNERNTAEQLLKQCARLNGPSRVFAKRPNGVASRPSFQLVSTCESVCPGHKALFYTKLVSGLNDEIIVLARPTVHFFREFVYKIKQGQVSFFPFSYESGPFVEVLSVTHHTRKYLLQQ